MYRMPLRIVPKLLKWTLFLVGLYFLLIPAIFISYRHFTEVVHQPTPQVGVANDASRLNATVIAFEAKPSSLSQEQAIAEIQALLLYADSAKLSVSIAGAQHSMGGHTITPQGVLLNMRGIRHLQLEPGDSVLQVGGGALWSEVVPYLHEHGKSVWVMQSNNNFSVGGSLSVNCHGWQPNTGPIASTVASFRLVRANGELVNCSRQENAELFSLVLGGFGLFGVIVDARLRVVDNVVYQTQAKVVASANYLKAFDAALAENGDAGMAYGRLNVTPDHLLEEAILTTFTKTNQLPADSLKPNAAAGLRRAVFRASVGSNYGKTLRWRLEKWSGYLLQNNSIERCQLQNESSELLANHDSTRTDILHEYFVPRKGYLPFLRSLQQILPKHNVDLLNITLRNVKRDQDAFLRYANEEVIEFVMLFHQAKTPKDEQAMQDLTKELVDASMAAGGTYYLPYRLHPTVEQFRKAYPQADSFFAAKRRYDPKALFTNKFYQRYAKTQR